MRLKQGVRIGGIKPEMVVAMMIVEPILDQYNQETVVTSICDGKHSDRSRHYIGYALDLRTWTLSRDNTVKAAVKSIQEALGGEYFVLAESDHIHIGFRGKPHD